jgi:hypothetical protein
MPSFSDWPTSPLDAAQRAFDLLVIPPTPLAFDGRGLDGCPAQLMPLEELKRFLLHRATPPPVRDVVWRELVTRARRDGPAWVVAAVGLAMPGLRALAGKLTAGYRGDTDDIDAETLATFVAKLREVDMEQPKVLQRMLWAAERAGRKIRYSDTRTDTLDVESVGPRAPLRPWDHPDLVLARAVLAAVIDADEANIIATTRLEGIPVETVAARWGITPQLASQWRKAAETKLVEAIRSGELNGMVLRPRNQRRTCRSAVTPLTSPLISRSAVSGVATGSVLTPEIVLPTLTRL